MKKKVKTFQIKGYYFSPTLLPSLVFLSLFPLLISLGIWQIHRGEEKQRTQLEFLKRNQAIPINLSQLTMTADKKINAYVLAEGYFDNKHNFLLDNKIYQHQIGYEVLTPFFLKNRHTAILVNRGWIPQKINRKILPLIKAIHGNLIIEGFLLWPKKTFSLEATIEKNWPQRIQVVTPQFLKQRGLNPFLIMIDKQHTYSFIPRRPIIFPASRHYAYAFQWFSLSLTLLIAFFSTQTHRL